MLVLGNTENNPADRQESIEGITVKHRLLEIKKIPVFCQINIAAGYQSKLQLSLLWRGVAFYHP
jgi:hypothetical protein